MKTAISIPNPIFKAAEALSRRLKVSRSQLYADAVDSYVHAKTQSGVTEALDKIYENTASQLDAALGKMQFVSLPKEKW